MHIHTDNIPIGVFGFGDLGRRMVAQLLLTNNKVIVFDPMFNIPTMELKQAIDPSLDGLGSDHMPTMATSPHDILQKCSLLHWCVPSEALNELPPLPPGCTVVLHDSVMTNSLEAIRLRDEIEQFVLAHCLMNDTKRVFVSTEYGSYEMIQSHFIKIGLSPKPTNIVDHDTLMARTQGVFALLIELGIRKELDAAFDSGDLTPSAIELHAAVINREANWTKQTLQSILSNPELQPFINEMGDILAKSSRTGMR